MIVRHVESGDVDRIVDRASKRLVHDAARNDLVNPTFNESHFADALARASDQTWVAEENAVLVGHLYGALLESPEYGKGAWVGPDGVSFDGPEALDALYAVGGSSWIANDAVEHYAWVFDDAADTSPWYELGFARMHARGVIALEMRRAVNWPLGYSVRRGESEDLVTALELDHILDVAQQRGPSFSLFVEHGSRPEEMLDTLDDPDVHHYLVDYDGESIAQCITFPLDARRGSFGDSLHVSALAVRPEHEHKGIAQALIRHALNDAIDSGFRYAEANWRVTNHRAAYFWRHFGFRVTYVRLHRTIGAG
jgi:ribosomal protein S18 acetylase RimI-like enzyme